MSTKFPWDVEHERGAVPIDARMDAVVCDARRVGGRIVTTNCESGVLLAYDTPQGPKGRHVQLSDPGVREAVERFKKAQRTDGDACCSSCRSDSDERDTFAPKQHPGSVGGPVVPKAGTSSAVSADYPAKKHPGSVGGPSVTKATKGQIT